jgi:hypothetical protein
MNEDGDREKGGGVIPAAPPSDDRHWSGYAGEAENHPLVVDRGRYGLLFALLMFAIFLTALAVFIHGYRPRHTEFRVDRPALVLG